MTLRKALLAATVLALPMAARAQPVTGLYVGAGAGVNFRDDADGKYARSTVSTLGLPGTTVAGKAKAVPEWGWAGVGSIGWGFGNGLRVEAEGNYRTNDIRKSKIPGVIGTGGGGYLETYGAMVNALYDFNFGWPVVPYVGAGVGWGWNQIRKGTRIGFPSTQTEGELAYQGIAGVAYQLTPNLALTVEGRYYGTTDASFKDASRVAPTVSQRVNWKPSNDNYSGMIGIRYAFYTPPPPPAPAVVAPVAPPAAARTYLVFFDWDRADLTERARQIIAEAAQNAKRTSTTRIEVAGHADRSGTPQYNQRLSQRRADTVAAELVRQGIARSDIGITAFGESRPLVPTADGVREPQNRRVEIVLR